MRASTLFSLSFVAAAAPFLVNAADHYARHGRHHQLAKRGRSDVTEFEKRDTFTNARFTFYDVGLGACGITNVASDYIVALNVEQYGSGYPGPYCFKEITIQVGSTTATAQITDECMGCPYGGLDFSEGLFQHFTDLGEGVITGSWWFNDGSGSGGGATTSSTSTYVAPTTTSYTPTTTWTPQTTSTTPTTTWTPPTTSSTWVAPTTTSSTWTPTTSSTPTTTWTPTTSSTKSSSSSSWSSSSSSSSSSKAASSSSSASSSASWSSSSSSAAASSSASASSSSVEYSSAPIAVPTGTIDGDSGLNDQNTALLNIAGLVAQAFGY